MQKDGVVNKVVSETIKKTMFGITSLKGADNLNCVLFVHQNKNN